MKEPIPTTVALRRMYNELDSAIAPNLEKGFKISCTKGCNHCCSLLALIVRLEAVNMAEPFLLDPRLRLTLPTLLDSLVKNAKEGDFEGLTHEKYFDKDLKCPFLADGLCSVYGRRPSACRYHNVISDPALCSPTHPIGQVMRVDLLFAEDAISELNYEITKNPNPAPISIMMLWAFEFLSHIRDVFELSDELITKIHLARSQVPSPEQWLQKHGKTLISERTFTREDGSEV